MEKILILICLPLSREIFKLSHVASKIVALMKKFSKKNRSLFAASLETLLTNGVLFSSKTKWAKFIGVSEVAISNWLTEHEHCQLLDQGADMIFQRPLATRLFIRYSKILLRRGAGVPPALLEPIQSASVVLDPGRRAVSLKKQGEEDKLVRLTQLEFRLLYVLMTNEGQVMPTEELVEKVWGYTGEGNRDLVRGLVRRLRRKIELNEDNQKLNENLIQNLPGVGYRFNLEEN